MKINKISFSFLFLIIGLLFFSCSKDSESEDNSNNEFSFTLDGTTYSYDKFTATLDQSNRKISIEKVDGDNIFTLNYLLDPGVGTHGMEWGVGTFFFVVNMQQDEFWTQDEATSKIIVLENDTENRRISATFEGICEQDNTNGVITFTNGVLKVDY